MDLANVPFSDYMEAGDTVYVSGQIAFDAHRHFVGGDIRLQTEYALRRIESVLADAGCSVSDVIKTTVYLTQVRRDFDGMNEVYSAFFRDRHGALPARTTIGVALAVDALIEIDAVAIRKRDKTHKAESSR